MEYFKLIAGVVLLIVFIWLFLRIKERKGFISKIFYLDIMIGIIASLYLIVTSVASFI